MKGLNYSWLPVIFAQTCSVHVVIANIYVILTTFRYLS